MMPGKVNPGTPSMSAGRRRPCQWMLVGSERRLVTFRVTVSPSRKRRIGAGTDPLTAVAMRFRPVMLMGVGPIVRSKVSPLRVSGAADAARAAVSHPADIAAPPTTATPCTNRRRVAADGDDEFRCIELTLRRRRPMHLPKLGLWKIGMAVNHVPREGYAMSRNLVSKACAFLAGLFLVLAAIASPTAIFAHDDQHHALAAPTGGGPHGPNLGSDMATAASSMGGMAMDDDAPVWPATFGGRVLT